MKEDSIYWPASIVICKQIFRMGGSDNTDWKFQTCFQSFCDRHELGQKWQSAKDYGTENPGSTLFIIAVVAMCSFPIFCFLAFVVGSLIIGFTIFLFVEGNYDLF